MQFKWLLVASLAGVSAMAEIPTVPNPLDTLKKPAPAPAPKVEPKAVAKKDEAPTLASILGTKSQWGQFAKLATLEQDAEGDKIREQIAKLDPKLNLALLGAPNYALLGTALFKDLVESVSISEEQDKSRSSIVLIRFKDGGVIRIESLKFTQGEREALTKEGAEDKKAKDEKEKFLVVKDAKQALGFLDQFETKHFSLLAGTDTPPYETVVSQGRRKPIAGKGKPPARYEHR